MKLRLLGRWTDDLTVLSDAPLASDRVEELAGLGATIAPVPLSSVAAGTTALPHGGATIGMPRVRTMFVDGTTAEYETLIAHADATPNNCFPAPLAALGSTTAEAVTGGSAGPAGSFLAPDGTIPVDAMGTTAVPGVWAAGTVTDPKMRAMNAAAAGASAAAMITAYLTLS